MLLGEVKFFCHKVKNVLVILNRLRETTACDFLQQVSIAFFHVNLNLLQSQKMLDEKQAKKKVKEIEKMEKEKRLQKLKSQVSYRYG